MLYVVTYILCTIVGVYSCAVDANQCVRSLRRVGCIGATVCEARLNSETPTGASLLKHGTRVVRRPESGVEKPTPLPAGEDPGLGLSAAAGIPVGLEICRRSRRVTTNESPQMR